MQFRLKMEMYVQYFHQILWPVHIRFCRISKRAMVFLRFQIVRLSVREHHRDLCLCANTTYEWYKIISVQVEIDGK
jgi:hypothetical protein